MVDIRQVGSTRFLWGESLRWDERARRLYFVDAARSMLHWLPEGDEEPQGMRMPSLPTGLALTTSGRVLVVLEDGIHLVDVAEGRVEKFADNPAPPPEPRLNDAQADRHGNLITGSLAFRHDPVGHFWWLSQTGEWRELDRGVSDANGPVISRDGRTLLIVDTAEKAVFRYDYDAGTGVVGDKTVLADTTDVPGAHDGATLDTGGGYWSAMTGGDSVIRVDPDGRVTHRIELPVDYPTSAAFGGTHRDRLYVTSVSMELGDVKPVASAAGALLEITGLDAVGEVEPRFHA
ncbi:MAG: SMP-30/gluconolactonase/LRE family protein [Proteobacteria bacterium]|nr:SMP-30/gluconolactonase/LRE family protein [Pseudomonadota bacterium]